MLRTSTAPIVVVTLAIGAVAGYRATSASLRPRDSVRAGAVARATTPIAAPCAATDDPIASVDGVEDRAAARPNDAPERGPVARAHHESTLDRLAVRLARTRHIASHDLAELQRVLRELHDGGPDAVRSIAAFLRGGQDVDLARIGGGELVGERTLRQALIDTLLQIGGPEATAAALVELGATHEPIEIAMLARGLDADEPGAHAEAVLQAIDDTLRWAGEAPETPDLAPLFGLLQTYGGARAAALLQQSIPRWDEYALIALAGLPDGAGVQALATVATAPPGPIENPSLAFQALAQATSQSPNAAQALVDLARAGRIPDGAWGPLADALRGKELRLSRTMFDGTPLADPQANDASARSQAWRSYYIEWLNVRYEEDVVAARWSPDVIERQRALIDELLASASSSGAAEALRRARASLDL